MRKVPPVTPSEVEGRGVRPLEWVPPVTPSEVEGRPFRPLALLLLLLLPAGRALAWGDDPHRWFARNAARALPPSACVRQWLERHADAAYADHGVDPDRWRDRDSPDFRPDEGPTHYLDVDAAQPPSSYPREWAQVEARFGEEAARKQGRVPWKVEEQLARLSAAFKAGDEPRALLEVAHLSHYVSDAFSPLHATLDYNPRLSPEDKEGLHLRYEGRLFEDASRRAWVAARALRALPRVTERVEPRAAIFEALFGDLPDARRLREADIAAGGAVEPLYLATREWTSRRWAEAVALSSALVAQAWSDAGSPRLSGTDEQCG